MLIFNNTKIFIKKLVLFSFLIISILIWLTVINFLELDYTYFYNQLFLPNLIDNSINKNLINILNLFTIEVLFYLWSYISQDNNLSNWIVLTPVKNDVYPLIYILLFYMAIIIYYFKMIL